MHLGAGWFPRAFNGFKEAGYDVTRAHFVKTAERDAEGNVVKVGGGAVGHWMFDSLKKLREGAKLKVAKGKHGVKGAEVTFSHAVGDVGAMHAGNPGCMFQAASQFNCLEFVSTKQNPEDGISRYAMDRTQGPVCAIACPYGTAFRNYVVECEGEMGQRHEAQLDGLMEFARYLKNVPDNQLSANGARGKYYTNTNGYVDSDQARLSELTDKIKAYSKEERGQLRDKIRIGVHCGTEVGYYGTGDAPSPPVLVGQAYCSALAVGYSRTHPQHWEAFARVVLEAAYEATLWAAVLNHDFASPAPPKVFLTKLGGGVFGNEAKWIVEAIQSAIAEFQKHTHRGVPLDVVLVHYGAEEAAYTGVEYVAPGRASSEPFVPVYAPYTNDSEHSLDAFHQRVLTK
eukprot:TRINITY_DN1492_c0_g2_i1.p1 TRINITY_DN1492_c0_g2~~TRINITY_DN1492_c0_g2_i1.p1  ORF type:complete len:414 (+),score=152.04 TRINITY_DN1492_c0_g2_i1:48-1244(+)